MEKTAVVIADTTGTIIYWSKGAEEIFGHSIKDALGQTLDLMIPEEFRGPHWMGFRRAITSGSAVLEGKKSLFPVLMADGRIEEKSGELSLLRSGNLELMGCMVVFD